MKLITSSTQPPALRFLVGLNRVCMRGKGVASIALALLVMTFNPAHAQAGIRILAQPVEYVPFEVVVSFNQSYCFDPVFPLLGDVQYSAGTLSVVLTHLSSPLRPEGSIVTCGQERKFIVPGLPRGQQTIRIDVTKKNDGPSFQVAGALISETVATNVAIAAISANTTLVNFWTGVFSPASGGARSFSLTPSRFSRFLTEWDWLEAGDAEKNYTFKAFQFVEGDRLPDIVARLYLVSYPAPFTGSFWTIEKAVAQRLAVEWGKPILETVWAVGRLTQGACPISMSPVYQTFHPQAVNHRWTQSRTAYAALLANGYLGEGASWCAPALRGE